MAAHEVVIVGGGVAGLAAAARLHRRGIRDVVVLEREAEAGGVPRHCGHWGFGWESHRRLMSGPAFADRLRRETADCDVRTRTAALEFLAPDVMRIQSPSGLAEIAARQIIVATGARESSPASRLIGGIRSSSVMNTGTLQQLVYLKNIRPFERPIILGGEWVSFSALMTCRHAGIKPAAIVVEDDRTDAPRIFSLGSRWYYGVRVLTGARLHTIQGASGVEVVEIEQKNGDRRTIACDGVIVSGKFVPELSLLMNGALAPFGSPAGVKQREAAKLHPHIRFAGNVQGLLKTAGRCAVEARATADRIGGDRA